MRECPQCGAPAAPGACECPCCGCGEHATGQVDHLPVSDTGARLEPVPLAAAAVAGAAAVAAALVSPWALVGVAAAAAVGLGAVRAMHPRRGR
jgi:hypothetical protein